MEEHRKIVKYSTVAAKDLVEFESAVKRALDDGWQPYGNPVLDFFGRMMQAFVTYSPWAVEVALKKFSHDTKTSQKVVDSADGGQGGRPGDGLLDNEDAPPQAVAQEPASRLTRQ